MEHLTTAKRFVVALSGSSACPFLCVVQLQEGLLSLGIVILQKVITFFFFLEGTQNAVQLHL